MDEECTVMPPGTFHSEEFYPYILWSKIITMPFQTYIVQEITLGARVLPRPDATPLGKQMPS
jgi:hypothetical protein